jgi:hypothetical protein
MRYLTIEKVMEISAEVLGGRPTLRKQGLLESAVARPQTSAFGEDAIVLLRDRMHRRS